MKKAVWILGDQLSMKSSSLAAIAAGTDLVLMIESLERAREHNYHKAKLMLLYSAMRHFKLELEDAGYTVHYDELGEGKNFLQGLKAFVKTNGVTELAIMQPAEAAADAFVHGLSQGIGIPVAITPNNMFLTPREAFIAKHRGKKHLVMEHFYRDMRRNLHVLMTPQGEPEGGVWNLDKENRNPIKTKISIPALPQFKKDSIDLEVETVVNQYFKNNFGTTANFNLPTTRLGAEIFFDHFITHRLPLFGDYEDAMLQSELVLFHSFVSPLVNIGLLDVMTLVRRVEAEYHQGRAPLNAAEGFIRQLIGWREFMYGCYWTKMSAGNYHDENFLEATRALPPFYWTGDATILSSGSRKMNCISQCVLKVREHGYTHHIERLMVLGNFALIAGVRPSEINDWFWECYLDAYDWVVTPNVVGMSQFADGGFVATKPYAASANYISKMSDYCSHCRFDKNAKTGETACPFNYLYWDFYMRNESKLRKNPRIGMAYVLLDKKSPEEKSDIAASAQKFFDGL
ncbi:MAG: cryptochrome/photolyase family protein [Rhizobacter sp.]|nr:cryptochrome/photolyase family protein [Chlorobiales bacterium]